MLLSAARRRLVRLYGYVAEAEVPGVTRLATTRLTLGSRDPQLPRDPRLDGTRRSPETGDREDPADRSRDAQFRELSAPVVAQLGRSMEYSSNCSNQGTLTTPDRVEQATLVDARTPHVCKK